MSNALPRVNPTEARLGTSAGKRRVSVAPATMRPRRSRGIGGDGWPWRSRQHSSATAVSAKQDGCSSVDLHHGIQDVPASAAVNRTFVDTCGEVWMLERSTHGMPQHDTATLSAPTLCSLRQTSLDWIRTCLRIQFEYVCHRLHRTGAEVVAVPEYREICAGSTKVSMARCALEHDTTGSVTGALA